MKIVWDEEVARSIPGARLSIVATDIDRAMLDRARRGCFAPTSLRELPQRFVDQAFDREGALYCIKPRYREGVEFPHRDLRSEAPDRLFDLILCHYVAFTYFADALQRRVLMRLVARLAPHGYLAIGTHEQLPIGAVTLQPLPGAPQIFTPKPSLDVEHNARVANEPAADHLMEIKAALWRLPMLRLSRAEASSCRHSSC